MFYVVLIVIVADDISARKSLKLLMGCEGWPPETFPSAHEFFDHQQVPVPSCLVLDVSVRGTITENSQEDLWQPAEPR
jgi:FixJ family two-component response regulator